MDCDHVVSWKNFQNKSGMALDTFSLMTQIIKQASCLLRWKQKLSIEMLCAWTKFYAHKIFAFVYKIDGSIFVGENSEILLNKNFAEKKKCQNRIFHFNSKGRKKDEGLRNFSRIMLVRGWKFADFRENFNEEFSVHFRQRQSCS